MASRSFTLAIALAIVPSLAQAQDAPAPPPRFDLEAALADGTQALTAERAAQLAVERSPRIDVARLTVMAAEASVRAATAALVPRLDLGGRYAHVDGFPDGQIVVPGLPGGGVTIHIPRDQFAATARLSVPITDMIFAALPAMDGAEGRVRAERLRVHASESDVTLTAVEAFYRYVEARGVVAVATSAHDQAMALRDQVVRYAEAEITGPADRAAAEARVAQADEALARAESAVLVSGAALSILLGTPPEARFQVAGAIPSDAPRVPGALDEAETAAIDQRPEIRAMRESIAAQTRLRDATIATGYPHAGIYGYAEYSSPNQRVFPLTTTAYPAYELGAQLTWSPSDTAVAIFRGDEMAAQIQIAEEQMHIAEDSIRLEVRQAFAELRTAARSLAAARVSADAAEEAYRSQSAALTAGESILNDLLLADARATEARLADLRARIAAHLARARLAHATGETSD